MHIAESFRGRFFVLRGKLSEGRKKPKCVVLFSGGLDSSITAALLKNCGVEVFALHFLNGFSVSKKREILSLEGQNNFLKNLQEFANKLQIPLKIVDISKEFLEVILNPSFGYGANVNPCVDCKIFMLKKAKKIMEEFSADFVATGEVLGQRPMSQRLYTLNIIERESGLKGKLLRPLSAKLLKETEIEKSKLIDRENLLNITGRARKIQNQIANKMGIENIVAPTSGCCLLTDPGYAKRVKDKFSNNKKKLGLEDFELLMIGRHFRLAENLKIIVGRNLKENIALEKYSMDKMSFEVIDAKGPIGILDEGVPNNEQIDICAGILLRYSGVDKSKESKVQISLNCEIIKIVSVKPLNDNEIKNFRI